MLVFSTVSPFAWDPPQTDLLRYFVTRSLEDAHVYLRQATSNGVVLDRHPMWSSLRRGDRTGVSLHDNGPPPLFIFLNTASWNQN